MTARELHKLYSEYGIRTDLGSPNQTLILRALDLLAATEDSTDGIVRELWSSASRPIHLRAATALVAMRVAKEKAEAERDSLKRKFLAAKCGRWLDDFPGARAECERKTKEGKPCDNCPDAWGREFQKEEA